MVGKPELAILLALTNGWPAIGNRATLHLRNLYFDCIDLLLYNDLR